MLSIAAKLKVININTDWAIEFKIIFALMREEKIRFIIDIVFK